MCVGAELSRIRGVRITNWFGQVFSLFSAIGLWNRMLDCFVFGRLFTVLFSFVVLSPMCCIIAVHYNHSTNLTCSTTYHIGSTSIWVDGLVINSNPSNRLYLFSKIKFKSKQKHIKWGMILKYKHDIAKQIYISRHTCKESERVSEKEVAIWNQ